MPILEPTREQQQFINRFRRYVSDDGTIQHAKFSKDVDELRKSEADILKSTYENVEVLDDGSANADEIPSLLYQFMMKYELPLIMEEFVYHFIKHNEIDLTKLRYGVYLVDDKAMEASGDYDDPEQNYHAYIEDSHYNKYVNLTMAIPVGATITQINGAISQYKQFIKDRQTEANDGRSIQRVRSNFYAKRDREITKLSEQGVPPRGIVWQLSGGWHGKLTAPEISRIIYRYKQRR